MTELQQNAMDNPFVQPSTLTDKMMRFRPDGYIVAVSVNR